LADCASLLVLCAPSLDGLLQLQLPECCRCLLNMLCKCEIYLLHAGRISYEGQASPCKDTTFLLHIRKTRSLNIVARIYHPDTNLSFSSALPGKSLCSNFAIYGQLRLIFSRCFPFILIISTALTMRHPSIRKSWH
jgi:hypothetical protein